jgi:hypothetical protein
MIKNLYIFIITFILVGCDSKNELVKPMVIENNKVEMNIGMRAPVEIVQEAKVTFQEEVKPQKIKVIEKKLTLPTNFIEEKKLKPIGRNIPSTCQEWSDGCNTCSRARGNQASCTIYTCNNKAPFSCLKWQ